LRPAIFVLPVTLLSFIFCFGGPGFSAGPQRPPGMRKPTPRATVYRAKPAQQKAKKATTKQRTILPKINLPVDEGTGDSPLLATPPTTPIVVESAEHLQTSNQVMSLFPQGAVAEIHEDPSFRLMVTIHGTVFLKESSDLFRLGKGSALLCPSDNVTISTPACQVSLHDGSVVSIDCTESTTYIRDFHDCWKGHVVVKVGHEEPINLMPGVELIVCQEINQEVAWKQAVRHQIRRRGLGKVVSDNKHTVYKGEFSIPDEMLKSNHFLLLQKTADNHARSVIEDVTKTAALLHMNDSRGPFILMQ